MFDNFVKKRSAGLRIFIIAFLLILFSLVFVFSAEGDYTGTSFDTAASGNGNPSGITQNGTYFWITDFDDFKVYQYYMNGTYTGFSFGTNETATNATETCPYPSGVAVDDNYIWVNAYYPSSICRYYHNGTYSDMLFDTGDAGNGDSGNVNGIYTNGTIIWVTDTVDNAVREYNATNGSYIGETFSTFSSGNENPYGLAFNGTYFWILDRTDLGFYKYYANGTYTGSFYTLTSSTSAFPTGIIENGTYFWITDNADDEVYIFELYLPPINCSNLSSAGHTYTLSANLTSTGTCFNVSAPNVTLNCNGYWINYSTGGAANTYGVYTNQFNTTLKNCNIIDGNWSGGSGRRGVYFDGANNGTIYNNTVNVSNGFSIYLYNESNYNNLTRNTGASGSSYGILIYSSSNNTLNSNIGTSTSSAGIYLYSSSNNNVLINQSGWGNYGAYIYVSNNNLFRNCANISGSTYSVYIDSTAGSTNNTFLNCSYSTENVNGAGNYLVRKWYYNAYVNNSLGTSLQGVNVSAYNSSGNIQFSVLTNASGWISQQSLIDYINTGGTRNYSSNYTINATLAGYSSGTKNHNLTLENNIIDYFNLSDGAAPQITVSSPSSGQTFTSSSVLFSLITDKNSTCVYNLSNSSTVYSMTANSTGTGHTRTVTFSSGDYSVLFNCTNAYSNSTVTSGINFTVSISSSVASTTTGGSTTTTAGGLPYTIDVSNLNLNLGIGTLAEANISVTNSGTSALNLTISQTNLGNRVVFSEDYLELSPGETKILRITFFGLNNTGTFPGTIFIGSRTITVLLNVNELNLLFDSNIVVLNKDYIIRQGDNLKTFVELIPKGDSARLDVVLNYAVKDYLDNVYLTRSESVLVEDTTNFNRDFDTGILPPGKYFVSLELVYPNGVATSSAYFEVIEFIPTTSFGKIVFYLVNVILVVLALIIVLVVKNLLPYVRKKNPAKVENTVEK